MTPWLTDRVGGYDQLVSANRADRIGAGVADVLCSISHGLIFNLGGINRRSCRDIRNQCRRPEALQEMAANLCRQTRATDPVRAKAGEFQRLTVGCHEPDPTNQDPALAKIHIAVIATKEL